MTRQNLRIDAEFTEDTVAIAIESFLTLLSFPYQHFSIQLFSRAKERWLGADARLEGNNIRGFRPFYMQFKRPSAYPDFSHSQIVKQRKEMNLTVIPRSLFFSLLPKQPHHNDCQHNILYRLQRRLRKKNLGNAAYVCPLFLDRAAYSSRVHWAGIYMWMQFYPDVPFNHRSLQVRQNGRVFNFNQVPVLAEHISIPPHDKVQNTKHRYSFDEAGQDLYFHSPMELPEGSTTLDIFLENLAQDFFKDQKKLTPEMSYEILQDLCSIVDPESPTLEKELELDGEDPIGSWLFFGDYLRREYNIEQFAFISWEDS